MATDKVDQVWPAPAAADLADSQHTIVRQDANGELVAAGAGEHGYVLLDNPAQGREGTFALSGVAKAIAGGAIAPGDQLACDANGHVVPAGAGAVVLGVALEARAAGELVPFNIASVAVHG